MSSARTISMPQRSNSYSTSYTFIEQVQRNETDAWQAFDRLYAPYLRHLVKNRFHVPANDCDDVAHEIMVAIIRNINSFTPKRERASFRKWLVTIAQSKSIDRLRKLGRRVPVVGDQDQLAIIADCAENDDEAIFGIYERASKELVRWFDEQTVEIALRVILEKVPISTVAIEFDMSENAVRTHKSRVKSKLQELSGE